ncbi:MAG: cupin domain-containing protein [Bryobacteraceae bacterium]
MRGIVDFSFSLKGRTACALAAFSLFALLAQGADEAGTLRVLKVTDGITFRMGAVTAYRIVHPGMGAKRLTLNYSTSEPGHEFAQHVHDQSDDTFLVLQGQMDVRQGDSRKPVRVGQAVFVPAGQIHGTITTGAGTVSISFQCPPDLVLYTGARDSSRPGAAPPKGVITPGAVKILDFGNRNGFFTHPGMGSKRGAVAHRKLRPGESFPASVGKDGEQLLFVWKGSLTVHSKGARHLAGEREAVFLSGAQTLKVENQGPGETDVIQVQAPPKMVPLETREIGFPVGSAAARP